MLDLLTSEGLPALSPTKIIGNMASVRPFLRRTLGSNYWLELLARITRANFYTRACF